MKIVYGGITSSCFRNLKGDAARYRSYVIQLIIVK